MARLTSGDLKGDTARGVEYFSKRRDREYDRLEHLEKRMGEIRKRDARLSKFVKPKQPKPAPRDFDDELREYIAKPVDVLELIRKLGFSEENVETAAMEQPTLYLDASRLYVKTMRRRAQTKMAAETEKAKARLRIQGTVQEKTDRSLLKKDVRVAQRAFDTAEQHETFAKSLMDAVRMQKNAIAIVMDGRWAEAGSVMRRSKEREGRELAHKVQSDVRQRYRGLREVDEDE